MVTFGKEVAHKLYKITQKKEVEGGMEINVRTIFMQLGMAGELELNVFIP